MINLYNNKFTVLMIMIIILITLSLSAVAIDVGGEIKGTFTTTFSEDDGTDTEFQESLDLEFFLPRFGDNEVKVQFELMNPLQGLKGDETTYNIKKLYLKHKFEDFYLTIGRQPISWSYGSLLNPVDFNLGAVAMERETMGKYADAVEGYLPINWNSSLSLVAAEEESNGKVKWGIRGRTGYQGYDLTANYVKEPEKKEADVLLPAVDRVGLSFKGDLGPVGLYGSLGYYNKEGIAEEGYTYQLGGDYSFVYNYDKQIMMQLEYLNVKRYNLNEIFYIPGLDKIYPKNIRLDLLLGNISYPIDDFSSVGMMVITSLDDGSALLIPTYENTLPYNITMNVRGAYYLGGQDNLFGGMETYKGGLEVSFSYPF